MLKFAMMAMSSRKNERKVPIMETLRQSVPADNDPGFNCLDCHENTSRLDEYYMVTPQMWKTYVPEHHGMLCIGCLEARVGRELIPSDFTDYPVNDPESLMFQRSARLLSRLTGS